MGEHAQTPTATPTRRGLPTLVSVLLGTCLAIAGIVAGFCTGFLAAYAGGDPEITGSGEIVAPLAVVVFTLAVVGLLVPLAYPPGRRRWKLWIIVGVLVSVVALVYLPYPALSARKWPESAGTGRPAYDGRVAWIALIALYAGAIVLAVVVF